jgi:hypothetical protein
MKSYHEIMLDDLKRCRMQRDEVEREWEAEKDRYQKMLEQKDIYFELYHDTHDKLQGTEMMLNARSDWLTVTQEELNDARKWARYYKKKYDESDKRIRSLEAALIAPKATRTVKRYGVWRDNK